MNFESIQILLTKLCSAFFPLHRINLYEEAGKKKKKKKVRKNRHRHEIQNQNDCLNNLVTICLEGVFQKRLKNCL